jgi:hypothetical protein
MENLSLKNILLTILGGGIGYSLGIACGSLTGLALWMLITLISGEFVFNSLATVISHGFFTVVLGILLSLIVVVVARKLFGHHMSYLIWAGIASILGIFVLFTYGIKVIFHPESYMQYNYLAISGDTDLTAFYETDLPPGYMSQLYYGAGTGQLVGSYLGAIAGLWVAFQNTIGRKRKKEDKKEFDEYSKFIKNQLEK